MKRSVIIAIAVGAVVAIALLIRLIFFSSSDLEKAIAEFEDGDYVDAIVMLNRLASTAGYDTGEKVYYYRCRALNRLAEHIEERYADELAEAAQEKKDTEAYRSAKKEIEEKLAALNKKTGGDLMFVPAMKKSRVVARGTFFEEFTARYRGSAYIEDLDFEEIQKLGKTAPDRQIAAMIAFFQQHPNTDYISSMVKILFDALQRGEQKFAEKSDVLWDMIVTYARRYPTSPEVNRLYTCTGDNVNLRNSPGVEGKLVGKVPKDEILIQLEKSMDTAQVGDVRDYWYRVASLTGLRGWIFGKFLKPLDISAYRDTVTAERWTLDEQFAQWDDSHTPVNWMQVTGGDPACINFTQRQGRKIAVLDAPKDKTAGLFTRFGAARSFTIALRARHTGGGPVTVVACTLPDGRTYALSIAPEEAVISGRRIPIAAADWHEYVITSDDGRYAKLSVDGEVIAARIEPRTLAPFAQRGIYLLHTVGTAAKAEVETVRAR